MELHRKIFEQTVIPGETMTPDITSILYFCTSSMMCVWPFHNDLCIRTDDMY